MNKEDLKTLKDLTIDLSINLGTKKPDKDFQIAKIKELKAEAIKRAKQCVRNIKDKYYETFNEGRLWEIMDFNNLTEEDLKNEK